MAHHEKIKQQLFMNVGDRIDLLTTKAIFLILGFSEGELSQFQPSRYGLHNLVIFYVHVSQFNTQLNTLFCIRTIRALAVTCF